MPISEVLCLAAAAVLAVATMLPHVPSNLWWVRAASFPRVQIAVLALAVAVASAVVGGAAWAAAFVALAVFAWQGRYIYPYTPLAPKEMQAAGGPPGDDVRFMAANVLMENTDHAAVAAEIERSDPDVLLLMETDEAWIAALEPALARYPTVLRRPLDNCYGMVFATRLQVKRAEMVQLTKDATPAAFAEMVSPGGTAFRFIGLHPVPPVPGEHVERRDAQVYFAARYAHNTDAPVVAMGDFNTVAWSEVAHKFKRGGGFLDPRIGRGMLPSFDARRWYLRLPIDQFYVTGQVALVKYYAGPAVGSDHFPMHATVRFDRDLAARLNREVIRLSDADEAEVQRLVEGHRKELEEAAGAAIRQEPRDRA